MAQKPDTLRTCVAFPWSSVRAWYLLKHHLLDVYCNIYIIIYIHIYIYTHYFCFRWSSHFDGHIHFNWSAFMRNEVSFWCPTSIVDTHLHPLISCEVSIMGKVTNQCEPVLPVTVSRRCGKAEHVFHRFPQAFSMAFLPCFSWSPAQLEKSQLTKDVDFTASRPSGRLRMTSPWMVAMLTLEVPQLVVFFWKYHGWLGEKFDYTILIRLMRIHS